MRIELTTPLYQLSYEECAMSSSIYVIDGNGGEYILSILTHLRSITCKGIQ